MATTTKTPPPLGETAPGYDWFPWVLRLLYALVVAFVIGYDALLAWLTTAEVPFETARLQTLLRDARTPTYAGLIALAGAAIMLLELLMALSTLTLTQARQRRARTTYLRVRAVQRLAPNAGRDSGAVLYDRLHGLLQGAPPDAWLTLLATATPDAPVDLGVSVAGPSRRRTPLLAGARALISALQPDAALDDAPDPLTTIPTHVVIVWREFRLAAGPDQPIRVDDLRPMLRALQPQAGVMLTQLQISLQANPHDIPTSGWRAAVTRRRIQFKQRRQYRFGDDEALLEHKATAPAFNVTIRALVAAMDQRSALATLDTMEAALQSQIATRTGLWTQRLIRRTQGVGLSPQIRRRVPRLPPPTPLLLPCPAWRGPTILSVGELAGLWRLPTAEWGTLVAWLPALRIAPPARVFLPNAIPPPTQPDGSDTWVAVAPATHQDGTPGQIGMTLKDFRRIMTISGGMGARKTQFVTNILHQLWDVGFCLFDGSGDRDGGLVANMLTLAPPHGEDRIVILDLLDGAWPPSIDPLAGLDLRQFGARSMALGQLRTIFARVSGGSWKDSHGIQEYADHALLLIMDGETQPTITHALRLLADDAYRQTLLDRCTNADVTQFWRTFAERDRADDTSLNAFVRRIRKLLTDELTRHLMTHPQWSFDFLDAFEQGLIVLIPLPDTALGDLMGAVGMLMFQAFIRGGLRRPGTSETRSTYLFCADEVQVVLEFGDTADVKTAFERFRKFGGGGVYIHQSRSQLGEVKGSFDTNAASRLIPRIVGNDAHELAQLYHHSPLTAADIAAQEDQHYLVVTNRDVQSGPFSVGIAPWPTPAAHAPPPYTGPPWQTIRPADAHPIDDLIGRLVYQQDQLPQLHRTVAALAALPEADWQTLLARWETLRQAHLAHIAAHPGSIPDTTERQRWQSRLRYIQAPYVIKAAAYARSRQAGAGNAAPSEPPPSWIGRGRKPTRAHADADAPPAWTHRDTAPTPPPPPATGDLEMDL